MRLKASDNNGNGMGIVQAKWQRRLGNEEAEGEHRAGEISQQYSTQSYKSHLIYVVNLLGPRPCAGWLAAGWITRETWIVCTNNNLHVNNKIVKISYYLIAEITKWSLECFYIHLMRWWGQWCFYIDMLVCFTFQYRYIKTLRCVAQSLLTFVRLLNENIPVEVWSNRRAHTYTNHSRSIENPFEWKRKKYNLCHRCC